MPQRGDVHFLRRDRELSAKQTLENYRSGGKVKVFAYIESPAVVNQISEHLEKRSVFEKVRAYPARVSPRNRRAG